MACLTKSPHGFIRQVMRQLEGLMLGFIRNSPLISVLLLLVVVSFAVSLLLYDKLKRFRAVPITIEILAGVSSPAAIKDVPLWLSIWAWTVLLIGWIIIPTVVAVAINFGQERIALDADWEHAYRKGGEKFGLAGKQLEEFVADGMKSKDGILEKYKVRRMT